MLRALPTCLVLAALAALPAACGPPGSEASAPAAGCERVELRLLRPGRPPEPRTLARLSVPRALRPWKVDAPAGHALGELSIGPGASPLASVTLEGSGRRTLEVPGPFGTAAFTQVAVHLHLAQPADLSVELLRGGAVTLASAVERVQPGAGNRVQRVVLDLPAVRHERADFDALRVVVQDGGVCHVGPLEFIDRPLAGWLPPAGAAAGPLFAGEEGRPAFGLSSAMPLRATAVVPDRGVLVLAARGAHELMPAGQAPRLDVEVSDADGRRSAGNVVLRGSGADGDAPWQGLRLDLAPFAGRRIEVQVSLTAVRGRESFALLAPPIVYTPEEQPPTVLVVTSDAHRADHVGWHPAAAATALETPTLGGLARAGWTALDCWGTTDEARGAYAALWTAVAPTPDGDGPGGPPPPTLAEHFAAAGFATCAVLSARDLTRPRSPREEAVLRGFDEVHAPHMGVRTPEETLARARALLADHADRPLFLWVHLAGARTPYDPPASHVQRHWSAERGHPYDPARPPLELPGGAGLPTWLRGLRDPEFPAALYRGEVTHMDEQLAGLLSEPRLAGALVAFTAPHGVCLGEHGVFWDHAGLYPEVLRVPLLLAGPGVPAGVRRATPTSQLDLGRTLLDLSGLGRAPFPGRSWLRADRAEGEGATRHALSADGAEAALVQGSKLLVLRLDGAGAGPPAAAPDRALYDLAEDPACERDLAATDPDLAARLEEELRARLATPRRP